MSERDQSPAAPQPQWGAAPDWREDTAPGRRPVGGPHPGAGTGGSYPGSGTGGSYSGAGAGGPYSGAGASAPYSGAGASATVGTLGTGTPGRDDRRDDSSTAPQYSTSPVTVRRPDALAGLLLVLAGIAAGVSLLLDWVADASGWDLVEDGFRDFDSGSWQPPVVVLAGGVLLVLGVLALLPARSHKTLGVLALLVTLPALVAVVVVLNLANFTWDFFEAGFWAAAAVPVLGLLGSLKAMLTGPRVR
ncbi:MULTISPECIES: hypothetical protein [unclassified Blastococcus]